MKNILESDSAMCFEVRKIRESDIEGFRAALSSVVAERKHLLMLEPPLAEKSAEFIRNNIKNNHAQYVAEIQGEIVGWADVIPNPKEAMRHAGLLGMGVVAEHRSKGIGKELLKRVIEHSWKNALKRIELEVFVSNLTAIALYEKSGFKHEGTKLNARLIDGVYRDVHIMAQSRL